MMTILHTNDVHGKWNEAFAQQLRSLKAEHNALLLDAGDSIRSGNVAVPMKPESAWEFMAQAGYDAMTIGNREFHVLPAGFSAKTKGAPCPLLCANIYPKSSGTPLPTKPYLILHHAGCRVGLFGLLVPMVTPRMKSAYLSAYLFHPPLQIAHEMVHLLRPQVDLLIALTHIGLSQDRLLAAQEPALDLIIGGHSHTPVQPPEIVSGVPIVQAEPFGRGFGMLHLHQKE
jgi:2',3'-cyclic-nucleotide 2'-phosphodiesterase (5'-nucleotidase family)